MVLISTINRISRYANKWIMTVLALIIASLILADGPQGLTLFFWILFILISGVFSINGILLNRSFNQEVQIYMEAGKPVRGIQGFDELVAALKGSLFKSLLITFASILSLIIFIFSDIINNEDLEDMGPTLALAMAFVAISVMFLVEYPDDPSFTPGGLIGYYEPDVFPFNMDNLLSDVFVTYMDPATFMRYDEWSASVLNFLNPIYESDEIQITRLERAREKILLLAYLTSSNPNTFTQDVILRELEELFGKGNLENFISGKDTGLTWEEIIDIIVRIEKQAPEPFRLVDRIMVNLTDNYEQFVKEDLYFTVSARANQGSVTESSGLIVFFINKTTREDRTVKIKLVTDDLTVHPAVQEATVVLDQLTDPFPKEQPPLVAEGDDILSLLSSMLQVGDAIWFRVQPRGFGYRVIAITGHEIGAKGTFGKTFEMRFTKSLSWYVKSYAPKLTALGSIALPIIKPLIGF